MKSKEYLPYENVSPYSSLDSKRLENTKEAFKNGANEIFSYLDQRSLDSSNLKFLDVGCANGEFFYYLNKLYPTAQKVGIDLTEKFINVAKGLKLQNTKFLTADVFEYAEQNLETFDILTCFSVIQIFQDPAPILEALFKMIKPGGLLIGHGCFNPHNVSVNVRFRDDSVVETEGVWRSDFNQHSQKEIKQIASRFSKEWSIKEFDFGVDIPKKSGAPSINNWTEKLANGKRIIVNGANIINHKAYLVA